MLQQQQQQQLAPCCLQCQRSSSISSIISSISSISSNSSISTSSSNSSNPWGFHSSSYLHTRTTMQVALSPWEAVHHSSPMVACPRTWYRLTSSIHSHTQESDRAIRSRVRHTWQGETWPLEDQAPWGDRA